MNTSRRFISQVVVPIFIVLVIASYMVGFSAGSKDVSAEAPQYVVNAENDIAKNLDFEAFWKTWNLLDEKFVSVSTTTEGLSEEDKLWGALQGLAASYGDPYTVFFPPVESEKFEEEISGNFEGVGMEVALKDGFVTVVAPLKNSPAYKAGILAGDRVVKIDETPTNGMSVEDAVKIIRGEKGTTVVLTVSREGAEDTVEISIVRDVIQIPTIDTEFRKDGVFVIRLYNFSALSADLFREALREFASSGSTKLLLDVRGNPGGYLEAAVDMASWFLPAGTVIVREDFEGKKEEVVHRSRGYNAFSKDLNMIILVDGGSASASEILAGALREHGIAKLIGSTTFGKGSVQELVKITPETSLKVTIARWLTPLGLSISDGGLKPDIEVKRTAEDFKAQKDPQLDRAIQYFKTGK
ncbi:MAG: carboxy-terminal-processing protease, carboxyl-terminal processing protease [Candidatus Parcubacteria bacterium]|jgi:carboxyl-terminal processing protease